MSSAPDVRLHPRSTSSAAAEITPLASVKSAYQRIDIARHSIFGGQLFIDGDLQISEADSAYGSAMVAPLLQLASMRHVVILGGGDAGVLREVLARADELQTVHDDFRVTMVDIDGKVMELCKQYLPKLCGDAMDDARAEVITGDAFAYIAKARNVDAVIYDLTMDPVREGQERVDFIEEILDLVVRALRPGGVFSMQCCGFGTDDLRDRAARDELLDEIRTAVHARMERVFEQAVYIPSYEDLWTFMMAKKAD